MLSRFSHVQLFVTLWTVARQAPLSTGSSKQEYWSGLLCPSSRGSSRPRDETHVSSPALAGRFFTTSTAWEALGLLIKPGHLAPPHLQTRRLPQQVQLQDHPPKMVQGILI